MTQEKEEEHKQHNPFSGTSRAPPPRLLPRNFPGAQPSFNAARAMSSAGTAADAAQQAQQAARAAALSRLEAAAPSAPAAAEAVRADAELRDARRLFNSLLTTKILDELHHSADSLSAALTLLLRITSNILDHPQEQKYRCFKKSSAAYARHLVPLEPEIEKLLAMVGFRRRTVDLEAAWVFENAPSSREWQLLQMAREVLTNAGVAMQEKAARRERERQERLSKAATERERLRLALADDRHLRTAEYEARRRTEPAVSEWKPGQRQQQQQEAPPQFGGEEGMEEEDDDDDE